MSDLFHVDVPADYVRKVFDVMVAAHWHQFQVLTKRSGRLLRLSRELPWPVIVGGESGPGARPMDPGWVREIRDQCIDSRIAFFFKQWGGVFKKRTGRKLDERMWGEYPALASASGNGGVLRS